jgi:hypothetical protein
MATVNLPSFPLPETVNCPKCREDNTLFDPRGSDHYVCISCKSFIRFASDYSNGTAMKSVQPVKDQPLLPLGSEGTLKNYKFKVIAYLEKKERDTIYTWKEYLLYNYEKGYAVLAEYNGHWNFIVDQLWEPSLEKAFSDSVTATHNQVDYRIFNKYTPITTALIGEFDWDVLSDNPKTHEYIAPPFILSKEVGGGSKKTQYYWGEYTEPEEIAEGFNIDPAILPERIDIGANQPSIHSVDFDLLAKFAMLAFLGLLTVVFLVGLIKPERTLLNQNFNLEFGEGQVAKDSLGNIIAYQAGSFEFKPFTTPSFTQPDESAALEIEVASYVDNNWCEATIVLVNDKTNESWEVTKGIEYYHGSESGESWSEGSQSESIILSEIPAGQYHFNVYPVTGDPMQSNLSIKVQSNVTLWRNILLTLLVLLLYPLYCWFRMRSYEKQRWRNSDFSPYESE